MAEYPEIELLEFKKIYDAYSNQLIVYATKIVENRAVAEEIVADAFLKLYRVYKDFKDSSRIRNFLYLVTRNACIDHLRRLRYLKEQKMEWMAFLETDDSLEINQIEGSLLKALYAAIERLPDKSGNIIKMFLEGRDTAEIADLLQISTLTVRSQKRYAIKLLKAALLDKQAVTLALLVLSFLIYTSTIGPLLTLH